MIRSSAVLRAGFPYFAILFAAGFALGTLRVLVVVPAIGEIAAVLTELPLMLALSWWVAGRLCRARPALATGAARLGMGGIAFACLMAAEFLLSVTLFGNSPAQHLGHYATLPGAAGLAGQVVFALIPWIRLRLTGPPRPAAGNR